MNIKKTLFLLIAILIFAKISAQSIAHNKSRFAVIDPVYSVNKPLPASNLKTNAVSWLYGPSELECWRLKKLIENTQIAKLDVEYPGALHNTYTTASFRLKLDIPKATGKIVFRAVGKGQVLVNGAPVLQFESDDAFKTVTISKNKPITELQFEISTLGDPPALLIEKGLFSTQHTGWEWKTAAENWQSAYHFTQTLSKVPPHMLEPSEIVCKPENREGNLFDFGRELFGYVTVHSEIYPKISVGESKNEALDTIYKPLEQSLEMVKTGENQWKSKSALAFRYILADVKNNNDLQCNAMFYPISYKGAFACSDTLLTRIWMSSAYTLRLCMYDFLVDGVKRDRLPWAGDLAMSMMADAYAFGDKDIVRRSLTVLGRPGIKEKDINGIIDYSLWWIISQEHYQQYFGDIPHLKTEWQRITETLNLLESRSDASGFLNPDSTRWLFIDWVKQEKWTALQILWWWAQESATALANRLGDTENAKKWQISSKKLKERLLQTAWSDTQKGFLADPKMPEKMTRHANFLAVVSGFSEKNQFEGINTILSDKTVAPVGTPYMAGFEHIAIARLGNMQNMLNSTKAYWGGMLSQGATTFWEGYELNQSGKDLTSFYRRPYGKSLCHAWSAGPAAFLPAEILGLHPIEDGWKRFSIKPNLGDLMWVSASVPTPYGNIVIDINANIMTLNIPKGTTAEWQDRKIAGPKIITEPLIRF